MLGFFVVALDARIVNVALPDIGSSLGRGLSGLQWVVTGYTLTFSALLLFADTLSDWIGAKRAYGMGMAVFVVASAACASRPARQRAALIIPTAWFGNIATRSRPSLQPLMPRPDGCTTSLDGTVTWCVLMAFDLLPG